MASELADYGFANSHQVAHQKHGQDRSSTPRVDVNHGLGCDTKRGRIEGINHGHGGHVGRRAGVYVEGANEDAHDQSPELE